MDSGTPPSAGLYDFLGWFEKNKQRVAMFAGAVAVAGLVIGFIAWRSGQRQIEAEEALSAIKTANPYEPAQPGAGDALAKVAQEYPKTSAAGKALLRAGAAYFGEGNFAKAREQFDAYIRNYGDTPWVAQAVFGYANCLDAENKSAEAINKYKDFLSAYGNDFSADQASLNLARLYEAGNQPQLALEVLTKLATPAQPGQQPRPGAAEAQAKLRALMAKHPSLVPTNAPPVRPPQPSPVTITPQGTPGASPNIIVNPGQPTPGTPNPADNRPQVFLPGQPIPPQPAPVNPIPAQPAPAPPTTPTPAPAPAK